MRHSWALSDDLEDRFQAFRSPVLDIGGNPNLDWQQLLAKWDDTSNALQMAPPKGLFLVG